MSVYRTIDPLVFAIASNSYLHVKFPCKNEFSMPLYSYSWFISVCFNNYLCICSNIILQTSFELQSLKVFHNRIHQDNRINQDNFSIHLQIPVFKFLYLYNVLHRRGTVGLRKHAFALYTHVLLSCLGYVSETGKSPTPSP